MSAITRISLENIRCFGKRQTVALPRITVLVGENSTGKSTFLACCQTLAELACNDRDSYMPFNRPPFRLGDFGRVARRGYQEFELGGRVGDLEISVRFAEAEGYRAAKEVGGVPGVFGPDEIVGAADFGIAEQGGHVSAGGLDALEFTWQSDSWRLRGPSFELDLVARSLSFPEFTRWLGKTLRAGSFPIWNDPRRVRGIKKGGFARPLNHLTRLLEVLSVTRVSARGVSPVVPFPRDTYEHHPLFPTYYAAGKEVEMMMSHVRAAGKGLRLFTDIRVREQGSKYALEVKRGGHWYNISDVGLGVHSVAPVLAGMAESPKGTVLVQQPETHLHPQAEAFLGQLLAESRGRFVVETHSDFILDRLRVCVRQGTIPPEDLGVLWFEERRGGSRIHEIATDTAGNVVDAPRRYRKFFTRETFRVLGYDDLAEKD